MSVKKSIGNGGYVDEVGVFWIRPVIDGQRTWKRLSATTEKYALKEIAEIDALRARAKLGLGEDPLATKTDNRVSGLIQEYLDASCPDKHLQEREGKFVDEEIRKLVWIKQYFGERDAASVEIADCTEYAKWRRLRLKKKVKGNRAIELELVSLSNVFNFAVKNRKMKINLIGHDRPRLVREKDVVHCRDCAPDDANELHLIAQELFSSRQSEVLGWQLLIEALTGCRTCEALRLRMDARSSKTAGFVEGQYLWLQRAKRGVNPYTLIHPDLRECIDAHHFWHKSRFGSNAPFWFPGRDPEQCLSPLALSHALARIVQNLDLPRRTSHGLRSYYVTVRRSQGISDEQVSAEIGDKCSDLIRNTYGDIPPNWQGRPGLSWRPANSRPAWARWLPVGETTQPVMAVA